MTSLPKRAALQFDLLRYLSTSLSKYTSLAPRPNDDSAQLVSQLASYMSRCFPMVDELLPADDPRQLLQRLCQERGVDFASLSRLVGRNAAYIQQFVRRGTPRRLPERERQIIARHLDIPEHLLGGEKGASALSGLVAIAPLRPDGEAAQGHEGGARLAFDRRWLQRLGTMDPDQLAEVEVEGDSMAPTLLPGDELLVDRSDDRARVRDGLYLLRVDGRLAVKRLTLHPVSRRVTVQSDNPAYADWPDLSLDDIAIVGRVVWKGRRLP